MKQIVDNRYLKEFKFSISKELFIFFENQEIKKNYLLEIRLVKIFTVTFAMIH